MAALSAAVSPALAQGDKAEGEVRRIDMENKRVTLKHGEIKSLSMPPMTMVFQVKNPAQLEGLEVGAKVRFSAVSEGGKFVVTDLERAK
jgi:Cu/Ag efflux protein CusF